MAITRPAVDTSVRGTVSVSGAIFDSTPGTWSLTDNGAAIGAGAGSSPSVAWNTTKVKDGLNKLVLTETDAAGHAASASTTVTVNNTGITSIEFTAPSAGAIVDGSVTVTGTIVDTNPQAHGRSSAPAPRLLPEQEPVRVLCGTQHCGRMAATCSNLRRLIGRGTRQVPP